MSGSSARIVGVLAVLVIGPAAAAQAAPVLSAAPTACTSSSGGTLVNCPVDGGATSVEVGTADLYVNPGGPSGVLFDVSVTPLDPCETTCVHSASVCLASIPFTGRVNQADCTGPTRFDVVLLGPGGDVDGLSGGADVPASLLAALQNGVLYAQLQASASADCGSGGCPFLSYAGWECGSTPGCTGYYGNTQILIPAGTSAPVGAVGGVLVAVAAGAVFVLIQRRRPARRRAARV